MSIDVFLVSWAISLDKEKIDVCSGGSNKEAVNIWLLYAQQPEEYIVCGN